MNIFLLYFSWYVGWPTYIAMCVDLKLPLFFFPRSFGFLQAFFLCQLYERIYQITWWMWVNLFVCLFVYIIADALYTVALSCPLCRKECTPNDINLVDDIDSIDSSSNSTSSNLSTTTFLLWRLMKVKNLQTMIHNNLHYVRFRRLSTVRMSRPQRSNKVWIFQEFLCLLMLYWYVLLLLLLLLFQTPATDATVLVLLPTLVHKLFASNFDKYRSLMNFTSENAVLTLIDYLEV